MIWYLRFFLISLALMAPCWAVSRYFQAFLARTAGSILELTGYGVRIYHLQVFAPFDLAIFTAMVLASQKTPRAIQRRTLLLGLPLLVVLEIAIIVVASLPEVLLRSGPESLLAHRFMNLFIQSIVWLAGPVTWAAFCGPYEMTLVPSTDS